MERMDKMDKKAVKRIIDASVDVAMGLLKGSEPVTAQMINYKDGKDEKDGEDEKDGKDVGGGV